MLAPQTHGQPHYIVGLTFSGGLSHRAARAVKRATAVGICKVSRGVEPAGQVDPQNLRTEYSVLGSYITAMTGMRFQTVTIFLAAVGLIVSRSGQSDRTAALLIAVSLGLWLLDLRNRDVLRRLGARGKRIESEFWQYESRPDEAPAGRQGFFGDGDLPAEVQILFWGPWTPPASLNRVVSHAFAIDVVFLAVAAYAFSFFF